MEYRRELCKKCVDKLEKIEESATKWALFCMFTALPVVFAIVVSPGAGYGYIIGWMMPMLGLWLFSKEKNLSELLR